MTIECITTKENIVFSPSDVIVNSVNCEGVMGKGVALEFKRIFPNMFKQYVTGCKCEHPEYVPGHIVCSIVNEESLPENVTAKIIINAAVKDKWRNQSKYEWVYSCINFIHLYLLRNIHNKQIQSITIPPLGCGCGGLDWSVVKERMIDRFNQLPSHMTIRLIEPYTT